MKKKKVFVAMLAALALVSAAGCGKAEPAAEPELEVSAQPEVQEEAVAEEEAPQEEKAEELPLVYGVLKTEVKESASGDDVVAPDGNVVKGVKIRKIALDDGAELSDVGADELGWRWEDGSGAGYYVWQCQFDGADKSEFRVSVLSEDDYSAALASAGTK